VGINRCSLVYYGAAGFAAVKMARTEIIHGQNGITMCVHIEVCSAHAADRGNVDFCTPGPKVCIVGIGVRGGG
jgi:hypothetical protein